MAAATYSEKKLNVSINEIYQSTMVMLNITDLNVKILPQNGFFWYQEWAFLLPQSRLFSFELRCWYYYIQDPDRNYGYFCRSTHFRVAHLFGLFYRRQHWKLQIQCFFYGSTSSRYYHEVPVLEANFSYFRHLSRPASPADFRVVDLFGLIYWWWDWKPQARIFHCGARLPRYYHEVPVSRVNTHSDYSNFHRLSHPASRADFRIAALFGLT